MQRNSAIALGLLVCFLVSYFTTTAAMLGGAKEVSVDEHTHDVAKFAVLQLNEKANFPKQGTLKYSKVLSAKSQIVAGTNHILTIEAADDSGPKTIEVTVWEKLPSNVKENELPLELTHFKLVGPVAEANEQWNKAAEQAIAQVNQRSNSLLPYELLDVLSATPANNDSGHTDLLLAVKRGDKQENVTVTVKGSGDDKYHLVNIRQPAATSS